MDLKLILLVGGLVILLWVYLMTRQRQKSGAAADFEQLLGANQLAANDNGVIVAKGRGQLVYVNERARHWLGLNGGNPSLEFFAQQAQPADSFLELFAAEGQTSFRIGTRWVQATSHVIPTAEADQRMVVILRELSESQSETNGLNVSTLITAISEIGESIDVSQSVEQALDGLLAILLNAVPADAAEISLWDEEAQALVLRGWVGDPQYPTALSWAGGAYQLGEDVAGWVAQYRKSVLVKNLTDKSAIAPKIEGLPYISYIGIPLLLGERLLGVLKFADEQPGHFTPADRVILETVSKSVATAIYNSGLYDEQAELIVDMASLQQVARSYETETDAGHVYMALNERVAELIGADICAILLYDEHKRSLLAQSPFYGLPEHLAGGYVIPLSENSHALDIWENQPFWFSNQVADEQLIDELGLRPLASVAGIKNTALIPMQVGTRRVGMLQLSNKRSAAGFTSDDIQNLRILATQAAIVVENVRLYQLEQRREAELVGLQEMTYAIGALRHEGEFYTAINERIAGLMNIEMCGILLYDEDSRRLVSQIPFYGIADAIVQDYSIDLSPGKSMWQLWSEESYWLSNHVQTDPLTFEIGMDSIAESAGIEKTLLAILAVGERRLGIVQVANKRNGEDFTDADARLLLIFATQAAAIVENASLYHQMQQRADEATSLRLIAELAGSNKTTEESFTPIFEELARLSASPIVFISILDERAGKLIIDPARAYGVELAAPIHLNINSPGFENSVALARRPYISNDVPSDERVLLAYRQLAEQIGISSALIVPLVVGDRSLGELGIANRTHPAYSQDDLRVMLSAAGQIAAALERMRLYEATGQNLSRRLQELDAISRVSNELTQTFELDRVLEVIRKEVLDATGAEASSIVMVSADVQADMPSAESLTVERRLSDDWELADINDLVPIERQAITRGSGAILVQDYAQSELEAVPASAGSAVAVAFSYAGHIVGVIHIYHPKANYFDEQAAIFLTTLGAKASLSYSNAMNYRLQMERSENLRRRVEQLNQIFELGHMLQSNVDQSTMLDAIAHSVQQSVGFDVVLVLLVDERAQSLQRVAQAGMPLNVFERSKAKSWPLERLEALLDPQYSISESYFFPQEVTQQWTPADLSALRTNFEGKRVIETNTPDGWRSGDVLVVPLTGAGGERLGIITLDNPYNNRRPDNSTIEMMEIFAHQAAATIQNSLLYQTSLRNAEEEARLNKVMETIASTLEIEEVMQAIASEVARLVPLQQMTVALHDAERGDYELSRIVKHGEGYLAIEPERRESLEQTGLGYTFSHGKDHLFRIGDPQASRYEDLRVLYKGGERVSLIMPMVAGGVRMGAMHLGSHEDNPGPFEESRPLLQRIAHLAAVAIQNARLFNQAVNLQVFNESVVESIQQGIVVLDRVGHIVSFNGYMRQIYGWADAAIGQDLFDYRPELADALAGDLRAVLETAKPRERIRQQVAFNGTATIQDFYTYPLLAADNVRGAVVLTEDVTERASLEQDIEARAEQLAALTEVSRRITAALNREEVGNLVLDEMSRVIAFASITLWRHDDGQLFLEGARGLKRKAEPMGVRVAVQDYPHLQAVMDSQQVAVVGSLKPKERLPGEPAVKSRLTVPLVSQGQVVGLIVLGKKEIDFYDDRAQQAAAAFGNQVSVALTNAELFTEAQARTARLSLLNRVSMALAHSLDIENILETSLQEVTQMMGAQQGRSMLYDHDSGIGRAIVEYPRGDAPPVDLIDLPESIVYERLRATGEPLYCGDASVDLPEGDPIRADLESRGVVACIIVPITLGGQILGTFEMEASDGPREFTQEQIDLAKIIGNQTAVAVQNANLLEQTLVRTRELETLLEAAQATSLTVDVNVVYQDVAELMMHALDMDSCQVLTWDDVHNVLRVEADTNRAGDPAQLVPIGAEYDLADYPARRLALSHREVRIIFADEPNADAKEVATLVESGRVARIIVPLVVRERATGMVVLDLWTNRHPISYQEARLGSALGSQSAIAIENARLSTQTAAQVEELFVINDLSQAISATVDIDQMLDIVRRQVPNITEADELYVALFDSESLAITFPLFVRAGQTIDVPPRQLGSDEVSFIIRQRRPLILGGDMMSLDEIRRSLSLTNGEGDAKSYLGVPLIAGDEVVGVLAVRESQEARTFGLNDQRILTTVGTQLGAAIQNARLFQRISAFADELNERVQERTVELQQERDRTDTLYRITAELAQTLDMDRVLRRALDMIAHATQADDGAIMLIDPMSDNLFCRVALHYAVVTGQSETLTHPATGLAKWLLENEPVVMVDNLLEQDYWDPELPGGRTWRSAIAVRIETADETYGVLVIASTKTGIFTDAHVKLVTAAGNQVASAINNAELYHLISEQAERLGGMLRGEQEETQKSTAILEGIADGVMLTDADGTIIRVNDAVEAILEIGRGDLLSKSLRDLTGLYGASASSWAQNLHDWADDIRSQKHGDVVEERLNIDDRIISVHLSPVYIDEEFLGTVSVLRDITTEVEVDRMKTEFVSNVSHELRTPMTSIKGYADLMLMGAVGELSEQQQQFLETIRQNADRLTVLVDDLLNISKIDHGDQLNLESLDIAELLDTVVDTLRESPEHLPKRIIVTLNTPPDLPEIVADREKLTQVLTSVVDNAFNYTYPDGTINIDTTLRPNGEDKIMISVQDTGIGISDEFKSRIWGRFERNEEHALVMDVAGTGLGLSIAKHLVEMHNGDIWFDSKTGEGTTFYIALPIENQ